MMVLRHIAPLAAVGVLLCACGGQDADVVEAGSPKSSTASSRNQSPSPTPPEDQGQLLESGFGQSDQYAQAVALVRNTSDHAGQTVTVSVNFLDADGEIITTASQIDSFNYPGQTIASEIFADLGSPQAEVVSIEPTLLIEDDGTFDESEVDFGTAEGTNLRKQYGSWSADFTVENPTSTPLQSPAVRVACRNAAGVINGGGFTFPDLVPPNGQIVVSDVSLTLSGDPAMCTAYIGGPIY